MQNTVKNVVILGGGTAGWLSAAILAKVLCKNGAANDLSISLIESPNIATVGVGEASIPPLVSFNAAIGLSEAEFLKATNATIKLGIMFENWRTQGCQYMHAFGNFGKDFPFCNFMQYWLKFKPSDATAADFWRYSLNYQASMANKFTHLASIPNTQLSGLAYAYHFDAGLYAECLKQHATKMGVKHVQATVKNVVVCQQTGNVSELELDNQSTVKGDLFIDCSGMAGLLIHKALNVGYEDWSQWLLCDSALALQSEHPQNNEQILPYTRSIAHASGWQWQIPLRNRIGNGLVYSSRHMSDDDAEKLLTTQLPGKPLADKARLIRFQPGRRLKQWHKNVVAVGLSSGFLEPLESTSIHLIQTALIRLIKLFPHNGIAPSLVYEYNRQSAIEFERIRDFIILHYKQTEREDSAFWRYCKNMDVPESLHHKIALFKQTGQFVRQDDELFSEIAWQQVLLGQGVIPNDHHPLANTMNAQQANDLFNTLNQLITNTVAKLPTHNEFLKQYES